MVNRGLPVRAAQILPLVIGNRDHWYVSKSVENGNQVGDIEPAVQSRDVRNRQIPGDRKMKVIGMKVYHIEVASVLQHPIYHYQVVCQVVHGELIQTE